MARPDASAAAEKPEIVVVRAGRLIDPGSGAVVPGAVVVIEDGKVSYFPVKSPGQPLDGQLPWATADILYPAVTYQHGPAPG